jgi:hypothetical protein
VEIRPFGKKEVVLGRRGDEWVVESEGGFPADTSAVFALLRGVAGARSARVVSTNPEKRVTFQVDSTGVELVVSGGGNEVSHLWVGKAGTSYVRREGEDDVHVVRGLNRNQFDRHRGFRDHTILKFDTSEVSRVTAELPEGGWELARGDTAWVVTPVSGAAAAADQTQVDTYLRTLANVTADGFADTVSAAEAGLDEPAYRFAVRFLNGAETSLALGDSTTTNQFYAGRPDRDAVYLVAKWRLTQLNKKVTDLAPGAGSE